MINIALQSEFTFKQCYAPIADLAESQRGRVAAGLADYGNTFGHIKWDKECKKRGIKPLFGVRLNVVPDGFKDRRWDSPWVFIAKNSDGLQEIYRLVKTAYEQFYYIHRIFKSQAESVSDNVLVFNWGILPENRYINVDDKPIYELLSYPRTQLQTWPQHIQYTQPDSLANEFDAEIEHAEMVKYKGAATINDCCMKGAISKGIDLDDPEYKERYLREMELIHEKGYVDYFLVVADLINTAKRDMLVGPSRGSSAGSLVCYLMGITEIDPLKHGLIFERFIDINRFDLPDIDIDFPDAKRQMVIRYLSDTYGDSNVSCLGTVNRLKPKSAIGLFASSLGIPKYEAEPVKNAIIERSTGDARAAMCIKDTLESTDVGRQFILDYPDMALVSKVENHASHSGKHAAGIIVANKPLWNFGGVNPRDGIIMMDKHDAEAIGLLKIDVLGLRTLSVLESAMDEIGMKYSDLYSLPLDDKKTFGIFNNFRLSGVFQFEGYALQSLTRQMGVNEFNDIVAITSLARPGALNSGGATRYVQFHTGVKKPSYFNETHRKITEETYGIVIYQEQMMNIAREIGKFSWGDVCELRKAASKSYGDEFFSKYKEQFIEGASSELSSEEAVKIWTDIMSFGSWAFNKSHAVSYGLISYWTAWMKAHHPLAFAVGNLNNARDDEHAVKILRDLVKNEGLQYIPVDSDISTEKWTVYEDKLLGGLTNIKSIGLKKAKQIVNIRKGNGKLTPGLFKLLIEPKTEFDILFPADHYWGSIYNNPRDLGLSEPPKYIEDIEDPGMYVFIGRLVDRNLRDLNEYNVRMKRGGNFIDENQFYLNLILEDDTDSIICTINRYRFDELNGRKIAEKSIVGESWFLVKGRIKDNWRRIDIEHILDLQEWQNDSYMDAV